MDIFINGKLYPENEAKISVLDHGLLYGDGIFEGIRIYNGRIFQLEEHIERLFNSAKYIMLDMPWSKQDIIKHCIKTCKANNIHETGYIRLIVTRGVGDLGLDPFICKEPALIIIAAQIQLYPEKFYQQGLAVITVPTRRNIAEATNPCIKSLNYLNNILAKIEAKHNGYNEAIMLDNNGFVSECTGDNIFFIKEGKIITPPHYVGALVGITRQVILDIADKNNIQVEERMCTRYDVYTADEVFLTGTAAEVVPVIEVDGRRVGNGKPGEITAKLIKWFREFASNSGVEIK